MQKVLALLALIVATALGFKSNNKFTTSFALNAKSKALPFIEAPPKLNGDIPGDFGFDPLGISNTLSNLNYVRASELKHGRVAMLSVVGILLTKYIHILSPESDPLKVITALGYGPNLQILSFIGVIELATWNKTYSSDAEPGNLGFDPLNFSKGKSKAQLDDLKLKEIKNGRLAMIASIGLLSQAANGNAF